MGKAINNLVGQKFNRLTVISLSVNRNSQGKILWVCKCDCGNIKEVDGHSLKSGNTKSCGCYNREQAAKRLFKHGMSPNSKSNDIYFHEYNTWVLIKQRCYNINNPDFIHYGNRGIIMFPGWIDNFQNFFDYLEQLPETRNQFELRTGEKATLDRVDVNGNYEPGNLHWADREHQSRNRTYNVISSKDEADQIRLEYSQNNITEQQLASRYNCDRSTISRIINNRNWY